MQANSDLAKADYARHPEKSFADWYRDSLLEHGRLVLGAAADVFQSSPFHGVRLSARVPGVHWRAGDTRGAERAAGLIGSDSDGDDHGYGPLVEMIADLRARPDRPNIALEYTCLEKGNGEGGAAVASMAEALVFWVAAEAHRQGVPIGGENALAGGLLSNDGWDHIENAIRWSYYDEVTFLRLHDIVTSDVAKARIVELR
jgi:hypothetical protein